MLNHKLTIPDPIRKSLLIFSIIKEQKTSTNKENHKIKNYSNLSSIFKEITPFMEIKTRHKNHLIQIATLLIKQTESQLTLIP